MLAARSLPPTSPPPLHIRRRLSVRSSSSFNNFLSSAAPSLALLAPALGGAAAAAALFLASRNRQSPLKEKYLAEWILYTTLTPFNRCVLLRCPSVSFSDDCINLSRGRIPVTHLNSDVISDGRVVTYQRICVTADDGGVISLDWPEDLDLRKEHGLDMTVIIIPGTPGGSNDPKIRNFMADALAHGCFPIVMNPRGCAGSPITTPRLFTAADSDDICTVVQFINKIRPWTTMMAIGWGYGANMLTKYLADVGEATPLTAAVCIDTPFDLNEATRSFSHHVALDQKLTSGLIDILRANKVIFQGKTKGFDVKKALSAKSVRDFDAAISTVSYGSTSVEDFYSSCSTKESIGCLKVPVLFIQSDDGTVPLLSIPRNSIVENPCTSLLLCSRFPSAIPGNETSAILWCQHTALEWLSAVELALLKGRHPLLKDVDITINPSKGPTLVDDRTLEENILAKSKETGIYDPARLFLTDKNVNRDIRSKISNSPVNGYLVDRRTSSSRKNLPMAQNTILDSRSRNELDRSEKTIEGIGEKRCNSTPEDNGIKNSDSSSTDDTGEDDSSSGDDEQSAEESDQSQVLQTTAVVMNMLDVTMPGVLDDERKKKVLTAVGQGETLMKALEGAVPEDVRGKLRTAVTDTLQSQSTNLNLERLRKIGWIPSVTADVKSQMDKWRGVSSSESGQKEKSSENGRSTQSDLVESNSGRPNAQERSESSQEQIVHAPKLAGGLEGGDNSKQSQKSEKENDGTDTLSKLTAQAGENSGKGLEEADKPNQSEKSEKVNETGTMSEQANVNQNDGQNDGLADKHSLDEKSHAGESDAVNNESKSSESLVEEQTHGSSASSEDSFEQDVATTADNNITKKNEGDVQNTVDKVSQNTADEKGQSSSTPDEASVQESPGQKPSSISVTQALDALTGLDDSTQMAVNSVFGVLENMIDQLEKANNHDNVLGGNEDRHPESDAAPKNSHPEGGDKTGNLGQDVRNMNLGSDETQSSEKKDNFPVNDARHDDVLSDGNHEDEVNNYHTLSESTQNSLEDNIKVGDSGYRNISKLDGVQKFPVGMAVNPYWESPYRKHLQRYFLKEMPTNASDSSSTTELVLDPKEGRWKMVDQAGNTRAIDSESTGSQRINGQDCDKDKILEPSYVIFDTEFTRPDCVVPEDDGSIRNTANLDDVKMEIIFFINNCVLDSLKVEVSRKLGIGQLEDMESSLVLEMEKVASAVSQAVLTNSELYLNSFRVASESDTAKIGAIDGECIINAITSAIQEASHLRKVLPVGVIVGATLASVRKYFQVAAVQDSHRHKALLHHPEEKNHLQDYQTKQKQYQSDKHLEDNYGEASSRNIDRVDMANSGKDEFMVGAVTAALGASALFAQNKKGTNDESREDGHDTDSKLGKHGPLDEDHTKSEEEIEENNQSNIVSSLAEKAMSVAAPVVPTTSDGEVDHERLVTILAELGQKGGILRLIGKVALLWGGIRGAMSLTDRLISFLHISERPFFQRLLGFVCMALVLWSPVVIPLLPALVQSWTTKTSNVVAEYSCILGLYCAVLMLIILWGKRIRGYENPLEQYGLVLTSAPKVRHFLRGLLGGLVTVLFVHSVNALLGFAYLHWPMGLFSSADTTVVLKGYGCMLLLAFRGTVMAVGVALVEELLFRSWLSEEVAADFGYYHATLISGLAFSLYQRSLSSLPGFFLLSLALVGIKQRSRGKLYAPIGFRAGILTANFLLKNSNFVVYHLSTPPWLASIHPWRPFDGIVGVSVCIILATLFFPERPARKKKVSLENAETQ